MEAFFSDIRTKIVERLDAATSSIKVAMAWFTNEVLFQRLVDKAAGGVDIELIVSSSETNFLEDSSLSFDALERKGAKVYVMTGFEGYQFMHHKFAVIDAKQVITGSYNWSYNAHTNFENIIVLNDPTLARVYTLQFENLTKNPAIQTFNTFKGSRRVASLQVNIQTDATLYSLSQEFSQKVAAAMQEAKALRLGIRMDIIEALIRRYTAVGAARKLSNDPEQSGFIKLVTVNRADLTFEYLTAKSEFASLFDTITIKNAKSKLYPYIGVKVDQL